MACTDTENSPLPGDTENVLLRKLLNRLCNVTSGGGGGVSQAYVDARDAATLASANANAVAGDVATLAAAMSSASALYVLKSGDTMTGALLQPAGSVGAPALSRSGDTDTGIWYPAANTWAISTAGAERLRIDSSGNVGIGTTSPADLLSVVSGNATVARASNATSNGFYLKTGATYDWSFRSLTGNSDLVIRSDGVGVAMTILKASLFVGIGLDFVAPLATLHIKPTSSGTDYFRIDHSDGTPRLQVGVRSDVPTFGALWLGNIVPSVTNFVLDSNGTDVELSAAGVLYFENGGTPRWSISSGNFLAFTDNTYDIGAAGATRPRNYFGAGTVNAVGGLITGNVASLVTSSAAMNNGAAAALGTLTDAPVAGNPTKWIPIDDNGTIRYIPAW